MYVNLGKLKPKKEKRTFSKKEPGQALKQTGEGTHLCAPKLILR